jgi:hypothetical protein
MAIVKHPKKENDGEGADANNELNDDDDSDNELFNEETKKVKIIKIIREKI